MVSTKHTSAGSVIITGSSSEPGFPDAHCTQQPGPPGPPTQESLRMVITLPPKPQDRRTAAPFPPGGIATHPRPGQPYSAGLPHPSGWPACPAPLPVPGWALVHLSGTRCLIKPPRKQGQPAGAEEGAALGHVWLQGFFGPCSNLPSQKTGVWATYLTGCEDMHACVCVFMCVKMGLSRAGSPSNNLPPPAQIGGPEAGDTG